jgi:hypothetical protein
VVPECRRCVAPENGRDPQQRKYVSPGVGNTAVFDRGAGRSRPTENGVLNRLMLDIVRYTDLLAVSWLISHRRSRAVVAPEQSGSGQFNDSILQGRFVKCSLLLHGDAFSTQFVIAWIATWPLNSFSGQLGIPTAFRVAMRFVFWSCKC